MQVEATVLSDELNMKARRNAIMLITNLSRLGRLRDYEVRVLRAGLDAVMPPSDVADTAPPFTQLGELRRSRGLSQKEIAKACGVSIGAVSNWELGKATPSRRHHKALYNILGVGLKSEGGASREDS